MYSGRSFIHIRDLKNNIGSKSFHYCSGKETAEKKTVFPILISLRKYGKTVLNHPGKTPETGAEKVFKHSLQSILITITAFFPLFLLGRF